MKTADAREFNFVAETRWFTTDSLSRQYVFQTCSRQHLFTAGERCDEVTNKYQFSISTITVQPSASATGPFVFDLGPQLPTGTSISSVVVTSSLDGVDTTSKLISGTELDGDIVSVHFDYPGASLSGDHELTFTYTLDSGAVDEADFSRIRAT